MRFSIRLRFQALLAACAVFTGLIIALILFTTNSVDRDLTRVSAESFPDFLEAVHCRTDFGRLVTLTEEIILTGEVSLLDTRRGLVAEFRRHLEEIRSAARAPGHVDRLLEKLVAYDTPTRALVLRLLDERLPPDLESPFGPMELAELSAMSQHALQDLQELLASTQQDQEDLMVSRMGDVRHTLEQQSRIVLGASVVAILLLFWWLAIQVRRIVTPLRALSDAANAVALGDLEDRREIPLQGNDEIGDLARAFAEMRRGLRESTVSKEHVDGILASMADLVVVCDPDLKVRTINPAAADLLGCAEADVVDRGFDTFVAEESRDVFLESVQTLAETDSLPEVELNVRRSDGSSVPVRLAGAALRDRFGPLQGYVFSGADFSEWKQIQEELVQAKQAAEEGTLAKSAFLATMSHEIRTPMTAVLGFAEVLMDPDLDVESRTEAIETIYSNGQHLIELINSVLDLSKIEAGRLEVERLDCDPCDLLEGTCALMRGPAEAKGLRLELDYTSGIPARIRTDPMRVRQVLINVIGNALKFTDVGVVRVRAALLEAADGQESLLEVQVSDSGIGMTPDQLERVFTPFTQADGSMSRRYGGTGLGLTISRQLSQLLGGDLTANSRDQQGSTFRITVATGPIEGVERVSGRVAFESETGAAVAKDPSPGDAVHLDARILVADDTEVNLRLVTRILAKAGARVDAAVNGKEAVERAMAAVDANQPYDAILMDIQMPVMDGLAATELLRQANYDRPIIALTANAMTSDRKACFAAGCDAFATKPINRRELLLTIEEQILTYRRARANAAT